MELATINLNAKLLWGFIAQRMGSLSLIERESLLAENLLLEDSLSKALYEYLTQIYLGVEQFNGGEQVTVLNKNQRVYLPCCPKKLTGLKRNDRLHESHMSKLFVLNSNIEIIITFQEGRHL